MFCDFITSICGHSYFESCLHFGGTICINSASIYESEDIISALVVFFCTCVGNKCTVMLCNLE